MSAHKFSLLVLSAIVLSNLILFRILLDNPILAALLFAQSILLYENYIKGRLRNNLLIFTLLGVLILISFKNGFDSSLFHLTPLESDMLASRHNHFARELGRLYTNKIGIDYASFIRPVLVKFNRNLFSHLDFALFFKVENVISLSFLPLFLLGVYKLSQKIGKFLVAYLIIVFIAGGFLVPAGSFGYLLYTPVFNLVIYLGLMQLKKVGEYAKA